MVRVNEAAPKNGNILISGAGIARFALAWWLHRHDFAGEMKAAFLVVCVFFLFAAFGDPARAADDGFAEEDVSFESGDATLRGTVLVPDAPGRKPAVALVHGSGPGPREQNRREAEAFARKGIVALIYDKRTKGYSESGLGERSYDLLASDALASVRTLREHPEVDPNAVGLWGLSEGAWVAPIAANRSLDVAFVVLVGASGVSPARQTAWFLETALRHRGVSGSMVEAVSRTGMRVQAGTGGMAEAHHDPVAPLERMRQPVLAVWGEKDRVAPPAKSAHIVRDALERGGNERYAIRFFPDAQHGLESSPDGFVRGDTLAEGYPETVAAWISATDRGEVPPPSVEALPSQQSRSRPLAPLAWWESGWMQLGAMVIPALAFASYPATAFGAMLARLARRRLLGTAKTTTPWMRRWARCLALCGVAALSGFVFYFGVLIFTAASAMGPVVAGRPIPWLILQVLAVATVASTVSLAASWWFAPKALSGVERARTGVLLVGGVVFAVWAAYWGLIVP